MCLSEETAIRIADLRCRKVLAKLTRTFVSMGVEKAAAAALAEQTLRDGIQRLAMRQALNN